MSVTPVGGTATPPLNAGQTVTIKQPDGKSFSYTLPTGSYDPQTKTWSATAAPGMTDLAKSVNRTYSTSLDADDFMKLLVAQLRYQDPSKPADTTQMMQQSASMAMVERVNEMTAATEAMTKASQDLVASNQTMAKSYAASLMEQRMSSSVALIGRTVTYAGADDPTTALTGTVESVRFDETGPILRIGGKDVPLASVKNVAAAAAPAPSSDTPSSSSPPADTTPSDPTDTSATPSTP